jgi:predicted DNA-binding transcriptional regulator AlpA
MNEQLYTIDDLSELLSCSKSTIWRWVADEKFPKPIKIGGITRWEPQVVRESLLSARGGAQEPSEAHSKSKSMPRLTPHRKNSLNKKRRPPLSL